MEKQIIKNLKYNTMVRFNEDSFTITVETRTPVEDWMKTHEQLVLLLKFQDEDIPEKLYMVMELLTQMLPDFEVAKKMVASTKDKTKAA